MIISIYRPEVEKIARRYNITAQLDFQRPTAELTHVSILLESDPDCRVELHMIYDHRRPKQRRTVYFLVATGILARIGVRSMLTDCNVDIKRTLFILQEAS